MNIEYKRPNTFIKASYTIPNETSISKKIRIVKCDCGFYKRRMSEKDFNDMGCCPECGAIKYGSVYSTDSYINLNELEEYKFTSDKGYIKVRRLHIKLKSTKKYPDTLDLVFDEDIHEYFFEYEKNKRGTYSYRPKYTHNNGEFKPLLKGDLCYHHLPHLYNGECREGIAQLDACSCSNNLQDIIWGINNRYKYMRESLKKGIYYGYSSSNLNDLKHFNSRINELFDEEDIQHMHKLYKIKKKINRYSNATSFYNLLDSFGVYYAHYSVTDAELLKGKIKTEGKRINVMEEIIDKETELDALNENYVTVRSYLNDYACLVSDIGFTVDEIIELYQHFNRQAFMPSSFSNLVRAYLNYKELGLPIDKKPRECAIYFKKMEALYKLCECRGTTQNVDDLDKNDMDIKISFNSSKEAIKKLYELHGYRVLDDILIGAYMNDKRLPFYMSYKIDSTEYPLNAIAFINTYPSGASPSKRNNYPFSIVTEENVNIDSLEEIKEFLSKKKREIVSKEASLC